MRNRVDVSSISCTTGSTHGRLCSAAPKVSLQFAWEYAPTADCCRHPPAPPPPPSLFTCVNKSSIQLQDPVSMYWPEFAAAGKASTTIAHVLSHSWGMPSLDGRPLTLPQAIEGTLDGSCEARLAAPAQRTQTTRLNLVQLEGLLICDHPSILTGSSSHRCLSAIVSCRQLQWLPWPRWRLRRGGNYKARHGLQFERFHFKRAGVSARG